MCSSMAMLVFGMLLGLFLPNICFVDSLSCYMCPLTGGQTPEDANIECLSLGWELSCAADQDRCYSTTDAEASRVEKGCTRSEDCVGTTACCQGDFCNADPQNSLTGYGKACVDLSTCVQGSGVMRCERQAPGDTGRKCLCTDNSYRRGATCKRKSSPDDPCTHTDECLDVKSTCIRRRCRCDSDLYSNGTRCDTQKLMGDSCQLHKECGGENTACHGLSCTCQFGFIILNGTNSCSGAASQQKLGDITTFLAIPTLVSVILQAGASSTWL